MPPLRSSDTVYASLMCSAARGPGIPAHYPGLSDNCRALGPVIEFLRLLACADITRLDHARERQREPAADCQKREKSRR